MLKVTEINNNKEFLRLEPKWNKTLDKSKDGNIYLTWEYLFTFWKHFGKEEQLKILCIYDEDDIVAIAPFRQSRYGLVEPLQYDVIEPLGYRGLITEGADYADLIFASKEAECLRSLLGYLATHGEWDFIYLMDIPENSAVPHLLAGRSAAIPFKFEIEKGRICPYIPVPTSMNEFLNGLRSRFQKNLRRCSRNLHRDFRKVELRKFDEIGSVEDTMKIFFKLHQKRWNLRGLPGVFSTQKVRDFYIEVARLFASNGWLALYFLTVDDEPVSAEYCFEYRRKMYYALGGFDPDFSRYSVSNLLLLKIMERCVAKRIGELDLLKGDEPYKFDWTPKYRTNLGIRLVNNKLKSSLYAWAINAVRKAGMKKMLRVFL